MAYYLMACYENDDDAVISNKPDLPPAVAMWNRGRRFGASVPTPLRYSIEEEDSGEMLPIFNIGAQLLMTDDLVAALREAGVDNLDVYDAIIEDLKSGVHYTNYRAVNIIGLIRAADLSKSSGEDVGLVKDGLATMMFDTLQLDESRIGGALMFRLAEKLSYIAIHESVRKHLLDRGFDRLTFTPVSEVS